MRQKKLIPPNLDEELEKFILGFEKVRDMGFVKSHRSHNTGIGKTLEDLMGVEENNIVGPDFGNIEIKSQRAFSGSKVTLFTKSPEPNNPIAITQIIPSTTLTTQSSITPNNLITQSLKLVSESLNHSNTQPHIVIGLLR